jgi:hypothetical protein
MGVKKGDRRFWAISQRWEARLAPHDIAAGSIKRSNFQEMRRPKVRSQRSIEPHSLPDTVDSPVSQTGPLRPLGITVTERYLNALAERSFLRLWSYPGVYRDQAVTSGAQGKEVCDLLVVFENHVLIFSDKNVEFGASGDLDLDWTRWFRRAIQTSAGQVWGAERWIREHPDRLFLDRSCRERFPIPLPSPKDLRFHRIVVAHDSSGRRRQLIGGSGSLSLTSNIIGNDHLAKRAEGGKPFVVGQLDPRRGYVHVFDDVSIELVLRTLDTITDFIWYLEKKERFICSSLLGFAAGEEDLLAFYLKYLNKEGHHDFVIPSHVDYVFIDEGHFATFLNRPEYIAKAKADKISYAWDALIENFSSVALAGSFYQSNDPSLHTHERILRFLAREPRVRRRMLARVLLDKISTTPPDRFSACVLCPSGPGDPHYVFLAAPNIGRGESPEEYRERRLDLLHTYCCIAKVRFPEAQYILGFATEAGLATEPRSEDLMLLNSEYWTDEDEKRARQAQLETGLLTKVRQRGGREPEYPVQRYSPQKVKIGRNDPCPCGSFNKYKRCCGGSSVR